MQSIKIDKLTFLPIPDENIISLYQYGSRVYGVNTDKSDFDYIAVIDDDYDIEDDHMTFDVASSIIDYSLYSKSKFIQLVEEHEISALECLFLDPKFVLKETHHPNFKLSLPMLREAISHKSSNSFVKARKKLRFNEPYIGKKSMWHSFRIIYFGIQIAKFGKIVDYTEANHLYKDIVLNPNEDEQYYKDNYLKLHNQLMTQFRILAPKE